MIAVAVSRSRETLAGRDRLASASPPNESPATKSTSEVASSGRSPFPRGRVRIEPGVSVHKWIAPPCPCAARSGKRSARRRCRPVASPSMFGLGAVAEEQKPADAASAGTLPGTHVGPVDIKIHDHRQGLRGRRLLLAGCEVDDIAQPTNRREGCPPRHRRQQQDAASSISARRTGAHRRPPPRRRRRRIRQAKKILSKGPAIIVADALRSQGPALASRTRSALPATCSRTRLPMRC